MRHHQDLSPHQRRALRELNTYNNKRQLRKGRMLANLWLEHRRQQFERAQAIEDELYGGVYGC